MILGIWFGNPILDALVKIGVFIVPVMTVTVMFLIWAERKVVGRFQARLGPMRTGPFGLLQSVADALKLLTKEDVRPALADRWSFELAPFALFIPIFITFVALPFTQDWVLRNLDLGLFYVLAALALSTLGLLLAGWGSANKYALLGGVRAAAQMISYELPMVFALLAVAVVAGTLNLNAMIEQQARVPYVVYQPLAFVIFLIAATAELHRQPFDMPVAESEVVGGPTVEYSGIRWSMFYLAEYASLWITSILGAVIFLGGWAWPYGQEWGLPWQLALGAVKSGLIIFIVFWIRASMPRMRIDQLMSYAWKVLLPLTFVALLVNGFVVVYDLPLWVLTVASVLILAGTVAGIQRAVKRKVRAQVGAVRSLAYARRS
ncbi:MAG TPA: NADH-quinone oxidoreductase subunit NuoH [Dehalococcoidia bacterium]